ncbi:MAG: GPR endopeptidase, partial [Lachnospiraceae bacterium]|nr:GPR endopeptidase [Lachnospiraceae bacterium]
MAQSIRTDLAMEVKESFDEDHVEIRGVVLEKREEAEDILVTTVVIETEEGAKKMEKPMGTYVTIEDGRFVTRHLIRELGDGFAKRNHLESVSGLAPGVMAQTGMETSEVIEGVCREIHPDLVIVVDALAAGSRDRLAASIQITNTGICPGSGVGNNRKVLNRDNLGADVIAIGVPMVMDMQE